MSSLPTQLATFVSTSLAAVADPAKTVSMAAYMKTDQPFHGVPQPARVTIYREMKRRFIPSSRREYEAGVKAVWRLPHREEKYAAIIYATWWPAWVTAKSLPLYERLIREGAWWDMVDPVAIDLVGRVLLKEREKARPVIERWIEDEHLWIRRTAILSQIKHKQQTDPQQLFDHCLRRSHETEFFIRKAIGWALRDYSYANPGGVKAFLLGHREQISGLSFKEGAKALVRAGKIKG